MTICTLSLQSLPGDLTELQQRRRRNCVGSSNYVDLGFSPTRIISIVTPLAYLLDHPPPLPRSLT